MDGFNKGDASEERIGDLEDRAGGSKAQGWNVLLWGSGFSPWCQKNHESSNENRGPGRWENRNKQDYEDIKCGRNAPQMCNYIFSKREKRSQKGGWSGLVISVLFWGKVSHCSPGWPTTRQFNKLDWIHRGPPVSASRTLGLNKCTCPHAQLQVSVTLIHLPWVYMFVRRGPWCDLCVEVRGQLMRVGSLLRPCGALGLN